MAGIASGVYKPIIAIRVTGLARCHNVRSGQRKLGRTVVERCGLPGRRRMTCLTILAEITRDVIGICGASEIGAVTLIADRVDQLIIPVRMTRLARGRRVRPSQSKFCRAVVEGCRLPGRRRVTGLTILAEIPCNVIRVGGTREIRAVALITICVDKLVVVVHVARLALNRRVLACQRESGCAVIERGSVPRRRRMTLATIRGKTGGLVIGIRGSGVIRIVALITGRIHQLIVVTNVARLALHSLMKTRQRKFCRCVIEGRRLPRRRRVAHSAVLRKPARLMIGIRRSSVVRPMTIDAIG